VDVRVRLLADQRSRPESLGHLKLSTPRGDVVPLSALIRLEERPAAQSITRRDRERAISIYGNVAPGSSQDKALAAVEALAPSMPQGTRLVLGGSSVAFRESTQSLLFALVLGIVVAYMVLAAQFNSFVHPVTVLTILPLSVAGAAFGLYLGGMTSIATLMAAIPAALGLGEGSETRVPIAVAILGGLVVSTALSLLVVPAFYVLAARAAAVVGRLFPKKNRGQTPPLARPESSA